MKSRAHAIPLLAAVALICALLTLAIYATASYGEDILASVFIPVQTAFPSLPDTQVIRASNLHQIQIIRALRLHNSRATSLAYSSDGKFLLSGGDDAVLKLWDTSISRPPFTLVGHTSYVLDVAISNDSDFAASVSQDRTIRLWDLATKQVLWAHKNSIAAITAVAIQAQGTFVAAGDVNGKVWLYHSTNGKIERTFPAPGVVAQLAFSPDGTMLAVGSEGKTRVWLLESGQLAYTLDHKQALSNLGFNTSGTKIFTAGGSAIRLWNTVDQRRQMEYQTPHNEPILKVALSPNEEILAGVGGEWDNPTLWLWNLDSGEILHVFGFPKQVEAIRDLAFSPDGRFLAAVSHDGFVRIFGVP